MAEDAQPDFIAQLRALNPDAGLEKYDDQTLAALVGDQHPEYKERLAKYFPDTAGQVLASQAAQGRPSPTEAYEQTATKGEQVGAALAEKEKRDFAGPGAAKYISGLPPGVRQAADVVSGLGTFAQGMATPVGIASTAAFPFLGPAGQRVAAGAFGAKSAYDLVNSIPELKRLYHTDTDAFIRKAVESGLGFVVTALGLRYAAKGAPAAPAAEPTVAPEPAVSPEAVKAQQKVGQVLEEAGLPKSAEANQDVIDQLSLQNASPQFQEMVSKRWADWEDLPKAEKQKMLLRDRADQMRPEEPAPPPPEATGPPTVERGGQHIIPNERAAPEITQAMKDSMEDHGVDTSKPQDVANFLAKFYGLKKPVEVSSVGEVPLSQASETPQDYKIDLQDGGADRVAHEIQHARVQEGQIPEVPEGGNANDQIVSQVTQDLGAEQQYPVPKYAQNINLTRLDIPENAQRAIYEYSDLIQRQQPIPRAQTVADATAIGMSLEDATKLADSTTNLHAQATAARQIEGYAANQFAQAKAAYAANPADPLLKKSADAALKQMLSTMQASSDVAANLGRALGSMRINAEPNAPRPFAELLAELDKRGKATEDLKQKLIETDLSDPVQRTKLRTAMESRGATLSQKIGEYYVNSILSGIPTLGKKLTSDLLVSVLSPVEKALAGKPQAGVARLVGTFNGLDDAVGAFAKAMRGESEHFQPRAAIPGAVGQVIRTPTRLLSGITDFVRQMNIRGYLYEKGFEEAQAQGKGFSEAFDAAKALADNPDPEHLTQAHLDANERVLLSKPGPRTQALYGLRRSFPLTGRLIAPILQIPVNVMKMGYEMSPLSWPELAVRVAKGETLPDARIGRAVMGGALWYWTNQMVNAGKITGSGPVDPIEAQRLRATGWQPHSFHAANGKYYPLYWAGPIGASIGMAADTSEILRDAPRTPDGVALASMVAAHAGRFLLDQPYMQGLNNVYQALHDTNWAPRVAGGIAGGFIPSFVARGAAAADPEERRLQTWIDSIRARVPFEREELPPKRDVRGRPIPARGTPLERFASPMAESEQVAVTPPEKAAANARIAPVPGSIPMTFRGARVNLQLDPVDRDRYEQLAGRRVDAVFKRIEAAPSAFSALPEPQQEARVKDIILGARAEARLKLLAELKKRGTLDAMIAAATGKAGAKAQTNPYTQTLEMPGAAKAADVLDRYNIPASGLPAGFPEDLAPQYQDELARARANMFYPVYSNPAELGSLPFDEARERVRQLEELATTHAAKETRRKASLLPTGVKSQAEAP